MKRILVLLGMLFLLTGIVFAETRTARYGENYVTITYSTTEISNFVIVNKDTIWALGLEVIIVYQDETYSIEVIWVSKNSTNTSYIPKKLVRDVLVISAGK
jgi:hypothetical protein